MSVFRVGRVTFLSRAQSSRPPRAQVHDARACTAGSAHGHDQPAADPGRCPECSRREANQSAGRVRSPARKWARRPRMCTRIRCFGSEIGVAPLGDLAPPDPEPQHTQSRAFSSKTRLRISPASDFLAASARRAPCRAARHACHRQPFDEMASLARLPTPPVATCRCRSRRWCRWRRWCRGCRGCRGCEGNSGQILGDAHLFGLRDHCGRPSCSASTGGRPQKGRSGGPRKTNNRVARELPRHVRCQIRPAPHHTPLPRAPSDTRPWMC